MMDYPEKDDNLRKYATARQWEILTACWEAGSITEGAKRLGIARTTAGMTRTAVFKKATRQGYAPEYDFRREVPDGQKLRGVSTFYDKDGNVRGQWVKTAEDRDRHLELLEELVEAFREDIPREKPVEFDGPGSADTCAVYPVGDHHFGMYAWDEEAGGNYNLAIAEDLFSKAISALSHSLQSAGDGVLVLLGDLLHYDTLESVTPRQRNLLDSSGRFGEIIRVVIRSIRRAVHVLLQRHESLRVIVQAGNHDPSSSLMLAECLSAMYEDEPRITVDTSPSQFHYFRFGRTLVGVCHGHEVKKLDKLPLIMATDRSEDWGSTEYRYWLTGHVHHDRVLDIEGTRVESFRVLPPTDAWAHGSGYRTVREMKAFLLHREHGEVQRASIRPQMF